MDTPLSLPQRRHSLLAFFAVAFAISWGIWVPAALAQYRGLPFPIPAIPARVLSLWGPSLAGIIMTAVDEGRQGLRTLWRRLVLWRVPIRWYLFALLWPVALLLMTIALTLFSRVWYPVFAHPPVVAPISIETLSGGFLQRLSAYFLLQFFIGSSMGGELGWRGFALPRLQARHSPLRSSAILGLLWALWYLPLIWTGGRFPVVEMVCLAVGLVLNAFIYTWVFDGTQGSLLPVLLLQTAQVVTISHLQPFGPMWEAGLTALLVLLIVRRYGAGRLTRAPAPPAETAQG